jgi:hypothetical protein
MWYGNDGEQIPDHIQKIIRSSGAVKARCAISRRIRRVGPKIRRKKGRRNEDGIWATVVFE